MAIPIGAIFASAVIGQAVGLVVNNFFNHTGQSSSERALKAFLNILSKDFAQKVETIVRAAFSEQNFLTMKADVIAAATAFRSYTTSGNLDTFQLDTASEKILSARSLLFAECESIIKRSTSPDVMAIADPAQKGAAVLQLLTSQRAALSAEQAIAALDLLILAKRVEVYPTLRQEVVDRVNEYTELAGTLKMLYEIDQTFRNFVKFVHVEQGSEGGIYHKLLSGKCYHDGQIVKESQKLMTLGYPIDPNQKREIESQFEWAHMQHVTECNTTDTAVATQHLNTTPGNITEAMNAWNEVKTAFA